MRGIVVSVVGATVLLVSCSSNGATATAPTPSSGEVPTTPSPPAAEEVSAPNTGIAVTGIGEVLGQPDTMTVTIGVSVVRPTVSDATAEAATRATALIDALGAAGVAEDDIQTRDFAISPQYAFPDGETPRLTGYQVTNTVVATLRDIDAAGTVIDAAVAAGGDASIVQGVGFTVEDDATRLTEARAAAFADARAKAEQLATLAGVELGPVVRIDETLGGATPLFGDERAAADAVASKTPFQPGQVATNVRVDVHFSIA
jgi:uncharacterized protein